MNNTVKFQFPRDLQEIPGSLTSANYTEFIEALSAFLRGGTRRYLLNDTQTFAESALGRNITLQRLRRLLHLDELLPDETFLAFALFAGGNYLNFLLAFDESFPHYYEQRASEVNSVLSPGASILIVLASLFGAVYTHFL
jgi:hypothetical protein